MKALVHCDDFFEQLTSAAGSSERQRQALIEHARQCERCRQVMAEVNAAASWVRSIASEPVASKQRVATIMDRVRAQADDAGQADSLVRLETGGRSRFARTCTAFAAVLLIAIGVALLLGTDAMDSSNDASARLLLTSSGTPERCLKRVFSEENALDSAPATAACCTTCHSADDPLGLSLADQANLSHSCIACHVADG